MSKEQSSPAVGQRVSWFVLGQRSRHPVKGVVEKVERDYVEIRENISNDLRIVLVRDWAFVKVEGVVK